MALPVRQANPFFRRRSCLNESARSVLIVPTCPQLHRPRCLVKLVMLSASCSEEARPSGTAGYRLAGGRTFGVRPRPAQPGSRNRLRNPARTQVRVARSRRTARNVERKDASLSPVHGVGWDTEGDRFMTSDVGLVPASPACAISSSCAPRL
jgi:hypothetical protein